MNKPEIVTTTKPPFAERYDNFIGGQWVAPRSGKYFDNVSPVTGKVVCKIARSRNHDLGVWRIPGGNGGGSRAALLELAGVRV